MDLKDFTDLGGNIGSRVNDAINNRNFDRLERDIRQEINQAFGGPGGNRGQENFGGLDGKLYREPDHAVQRNVSRTGVPVVPKVPGKVSGVLMMVAGYGLACLFGVGGVVLGLLSAAFIVIGETSAQILGAFGVGVIPLFLVSLIIGLIGSKRYGRYRRFHRYLKVLVGEKFCAISELANSIGKKPKFVCKDLEGMIEKGYFIEGHIDDQKTCFIGTDDLYQQYLLARDSAAHAGAEKETASKEQEVRMTSELEQIIAEGEKYIKTIREANDAIYNPDISEKLYKMESTVEKIFDYVRRKPEQAGQLRRFTSYYMPMTEKLVNAYMDLDKQTVRGENITKAKDEIANTLDTINEAYEKLYDSMYVDVAMDVSSDIAVLKTLFAQEGLAGDSINGGKKK